MAGRLLAQEFRVIGHRCKIQRPVDTHFAKRTGLRRRKVQCLTERVAVGILWPGTHPEIPGVARQSSVHMQIPKQGLPRRHTVRAGLCLQRTVLARCEGLV